MSRDLDSAINTYIEHFRGTVARLKAYQLDPRDRILKKNILASVLDALSRTTSNYADGNRERFTAIVANFGDWPHHTRVSAPHIGYLLRNLRSPSFAKAREFIAHTLANNADGSLVRLSSDPQLEEIKRLWPVPADLRLMNQLSLSSFTHLNLFYSYRNSLVHELREPGYGMEFSENDDEPFYHGMTTSGTNDSVERQSLELVYPLNFYFRLTESVIQNIETYLRHNRIDPYGCYRFGSSWVSELNA
jgi:hypothetical protein